MKKNYLIILIALSFSTYGQIQKGSSFIEGSFDFFSEKTTISPGDNETKTNGYGVIFGVGSFISDNSVVGGGISYGSLKFDDFNNNLIGLNLFFQRFKPIKEKFYFTSRINASYVFGKNEFSGGFSNQDTKTSGIQLSWIPGFQYVLDEKWVLGATVGSISYSNITEKDSDNSDNKMTQSEFDVSVLANNFSLSIQYYLGKKE